MIFAKLNEKVKSENDKNVPKLNENSCKSFKQIKKEKDKNYFLEMNHFAGLLIGNEGSKKKLSFANFFCYSETKRQKNKEV